MKCFAQRVRAITRLLAPWPAMPVYALVYVTQRCDAKCRHCFLWGELNQSHRELTVCEFQQLAASMGPLLQLTLTGGSPELRSDLPAIARAFHQRCRPVNLTICVNGYHTQTICSQIEEILRLCPDQNLTVGVSLDGLGAVHDEIRGMRGLFEKVVATFLELGQLKKVNPRLSLTCALCVSELNWQTAEATADWAHQHLPIDLLKPILVRGNARDPSALGNHGARTYERLVQREENALAQGRRSLLALATRAKEAVQRDLISEFQCQPRYRVPCAAARQTAVIRADGTVMACEMRAEKLGDLRQENMDLRRVWMGYAAESFRRKIRLEKCACHHHCFMAPAVFRSPLLWPTFGTAFVAGLFRRSSIQ